MPGAGITTGPTALPGPPQEAPGRWRNHAVTAGFLAPALVFLAVWIVYPAIDTVRRSFMDGDSHKYVGLKSYKDIVQPFSFNANDNPILHAVENEAIWIAVVPAIVTAIGL